MEDFDKVREARLCEIAYIYGKLESKGRVIEQDKDLEDMYEDIFLNIYEEWQNGSLCKNTYEEGYITEYAQERILELYGVK